MEIDKSTRLYLLRFIAAIGVILIHATSNGSAIGITIDSLARFSVPVFVILSGYYVLPKAASFSYVTKKAGKLLIIMLVSSLVYYFYFWATGKITFDGVKAFVKYLLTEPVYFWFFYMMICLYLLSPVFKVFVDHADQKLFAYFLGVCFLCGSLMVIMVRSEKLPTFNLIVEKTKLAYNLGFPFLYLSGAYIRRFGMEKITRYMIYALGILAQTAAIVINIWLFYAHSYTDLLSSFYAPNAVLMGVAVFTAGVYFPANRILDHPQIRKTVQYLASLTLGIYILHPLFLDLFGYVPLIQSSICLKVFAVFLASMVLTMCLKKLPVIKRYL